MSGPDDLPLGGTEMAKHCWYLGLSASAYEQEDSFLADNGQIQGQFNSAFFSHEPEEAPGLDLELTTFAPDFAFTKHHTMPGFGISPSTPNSHHTSSAPTSPKRAETYPSSVARNQKRINVILSRFDPGTTPPPPESGDELSDTRSVAQSSQVNPITESDEWPVPTFFLDQIDPTPPKLNHADDLTPEDLGGSPKSFGNIQSKYIEDSETNDYCSMAEDVDSVPLLNSSFRPKPGPYPKVTHSDSGIGSTTTSYRQGPQSNMGSSHRYTLSKKGGRSSRGSQAKGSVVFDNASVSASTTAAIYQQAAAKLGPLTSAASSTAGSIETPRMLSETALKAMKTIILEPILNDSKFRDFWDICKMAGEQMESGRIGSLRDLEKFLLHKASNIKNNQAYNNFCKEFLNHVEESLKYMPQNELLRPYDRPYDNGYFLDTLAPFVKSTGTMQSTVFEFSQGEEDPGIDRWLLTSQPSPEKRVAEAGPTHGSYAKRHKPSRPELIIPTADTQSYQNNGYDNLSALSDSKIMTPMSGIAGLMCPPTFPHSKINPVCPAPHPRNKTRHRDRAQQVKEQQTFRCPWPDCSHPPFTRVCDLTKHDKTHTRPHKCTVANCKYATEGFPTEKERDRHWADKHSSEMPNFPCHYPPCTYKSRRESNCKQHMEKAHGYTYVRMKQNYRTNGAKRQSNSPTSPGDQGSPMGRSPPNQQQFAAQPSAMTSQYHTTAFQHSMDNGFSQTRPQYSLDTLEKMITSIVAGNTGSQDTFMLGGNQEHTNTSNSFGHQGYMLHGPTEQLPYPDVVDPRFLDFTPMPSMPDENIDPSLMNSKWMGG